MNRKDFIKSLGFGAVGGFLPKAQSKRPRIVSVKRAGVNVSGVLYSGPSFKTEDISRAS